jgi:hypothetical protein
MCGERLLHKSRIKMKKATAYQAVIARSLLVFGRSSSPAYPGTKRMALPLHHGPGSPFHRLHTPQCTAIIVAMVVSTQTTGSLQSLPTLQEALMLGHRRRYKSISMCHTMAWQSIGGHWCMLLSLTTTCSVKCDTSILHHYFIS